MFLYHYFQWETHFFTFIILLNTAFSAHIHSKERVEDGAYSPKLSSHNPKKTESEFTHEVMLGT